MLASGFTGDEEVLPLHADARVLGATIKAGKTVEYRFMDPGRFGYLVSATGTVEINGLIVNARDGAAIHNEDFIRIKAIEDTELILVDAAPGR